MQDIHWITLADMNMDNLHEYIQGYTWIWKDILGHLDWISFLGYDLHSYPNSQKISCHVLTYPYISLHILAYPKISSWANSQMACARMRLVLVIRTSHSLISKLLFNLYFCIQVLWQCLGMPGKHRPLEALNSIVSACPRDLHHNKPESCTNGVSQLVRWCLLKSLRGTSGKCNVSRQTGAMWAASHGLARQECLCAPRGALKCGGGQ